MAKQVKIQSIRVEGLFDQFTYTLDFPTSENVAVIIGPNGIGKTTVLNLLYFMINPTINSFGRIVHVPFKSFHVRMSDGMSMSLERAVMSESKPYPSYLYLRDVEDFVFGKPNEWILHLQKGTASLKSVLGDEDSFLRYRKEFNQYQEQFGGVTPSATRAKRYIYELCNQMQQELYRDNEINDYDCLELGRYFSPPTFFHDFFIRSDRLNEQTYYKCDAPEESNGLTQHRFSPFEHMCNELKDAVLEALDEYEKRLEKARHSLLQRYLCDGKAPILSAEVFKECWTDYCNQLRDCIDIGFLDESAVPPDIGDLNTAYEQKGAFLCIYLETFQNALAPLLWYYEKRKMFVEIINKRNEVTGKKLKLTRDGVKMLVNGRLLNVDRLSSGEKNDLVLFYMLVRHHATGHFELFDDMEKELFIYKRDSLVIIDEPEISWHIVWQEEFLDQLLEICRLRNLQAIVTTHSPNIINGHFELVAKRSDD